MGEAVLGSTRGEATTAAGERTMMEPPKEDVKKLCSDGVPTSLLWLAVGRRTVCAGRGWMSSRRWATRPAAKSNTAKERSEQLASSRFEGKELMQDMSTMLFTGRLSWYT